MNIRWSHLLSVALLGTPAWAHFPFLVPTPDGAGARILLSETLELDEAVPADLVLSGSYGALLPDGSVRRLDVEASDAGAFVTHSEATAAASMLFGTLDLGFTQRGGGTPHVLIYYAKTLLGDPFDPAAHRTDVPIEITPVRVEGGLRLLLTVDGAPLPQAEMVVLLPDGAERELVTGADGHTETLALHGRYGAWARHWVEESGERDGKAYDEVRRYATLVFDHDAPAARAPSRARRHGSAPEPVSVTAATPLELALPEATSSFGAVQSDGWVYVYGGHTAPTHDYHTGAVSGGFWRVDLAGDVGWEELPGGPAMQGMNLAAHLGRVYRVGGMIPHNAPGEKVDNRSSDQVARFDPGQRRWEDLTPLPEPRSSHDVAVLDGRLYAIGGWNMAGAQGNTWPSSMFALDLTDPAASWTEIPQPFQRRALIVAVHDQKIFAIGGFDADDEPSRRVDVFDPREGRWLQGPGLPGVAMNGFSPAACVLDRQLYVSLGDGTLQRLDDRDYCWEQVGTSTPRIVHRMVPLGARVLVLGGASRGGNHDLMESLTPAPADGVPAALSGARRAAANQRLALQRGNTPTASATDRTAATGASDSALPRVTPAAFQFPSAAPPVEPPSPSPAAQAVAAVQSHCPIMTDEPVDATSYTVEHEGRTVLLCCKSCVRKWTRAPETYAASPLLPQLADHVVQTPGAE